MGGFCCGCHEVRLKTPYGMLWFFDSFWIVVYTTCVCWASAGMLERIVLAEGTFSTLILLDGGRRSVCGRLLAALSRIRVIGKVWSGERAGLGYLKHLIRFSSSLSVYSGRHVAHSRSNRTVIDDARPASEPGGERRIKSIRCPG